MKYTQQTHKLYNSSILTLQKPFREQSYVKKKKKKRSFNTLQMSQRPMIHRFEKKNKPE